MLTIKRIGSALGATIEGVTFDADGVRDAADIKAAWVEHGVVFFPGLNPTPDQQMALAHALGVPEAHGDGGADTREYERVGGHRELIVLDSQPKNRADLWHTDATFRETPPAGSILCLRDVPPVGGDTLWLSTAAAYDNLPDPIRQLAEQLNAVHGRPPMTGTFEHPVVTVHPVTGRRALYVNHAWTNSIAGMAPATSKALIELFRSFLETPELTIRWSWSAGDVAAWDNRTTQHYAVRDYGDYPRTGHRVIVAGERPGGVSQLA